MQPLKIIETDTPKRAYNKKQKKLCDQTMTEITGREPKTDHLMKPHFERELISLKEDGKLKKRLLQLFKK